MLDPISAAIRKALGLIGGHETRIRNLERAFAPVTPLPAGLIRFDVDNEGGWLEVTANADVPLTNTGILLRSPLVPGNSGNIGIDVGNAFIVTAAGAFAFTSASGSWITDHATLALLASGALVNIPVGKSVTVTDHDDNPIFRVDEDGSVHIKTGQTITADL